MSEHEQDGRPTAPATPAVLVTRPLPAGRRLANLFEAAGIRAESIPLLEIAPPADLRALTAAAERAVDGEYEWLLLTSANGVRALAGALSSAGGRRPRGRLAVVGSATRAAAEKEGWPATLVPETFTAEALLRIFPEPRVRGERVLYPAAEAARDVLPEGLRRLGYDVDVVVAYRSRVPVEADAQRLRDLLDSDSGVDLVALASPSAVEALIELAGEVALTRPVAAIGPVTAEAAERSGFRVVAVAEPHTSEGLVSACLGWLSGTRPAP